MLENKMGERDSAAFFRIPNIETIRNFVVLRENKLLAVLLVDTAIF